MAKKELKKSQKEEREEIDLGKIPFVGGLLKGIEKLVDLAESVEKAGGQIERKGEIKGLRGREDVRGIYGFSIRTGIGERPKIQTFGNIRTVREREKAKPEFKITVDPGTVPDYKKLKIKRKHFQKACSQIQTLQQNSRSQ